MKNNKCIHSTQNQMSRSLCTKSQECGKLHNQVKSMESSNQIREKYAVMSHNALYMLTTICDN